MITIDERRSIERIPVENYICYSDPFKVFNPAEHVTYHVGNTVNLSANGACIRTKLHLKTGAKIKLSFREPGHLHANSGIRSVIAKIIWCQKESDSSFRSGLFWPDLS